jgi:hypothetical protein
MLCVLEKGSVDEAEVMVCEERGMDIAGEVTDLYI